MSRFFIGSLRVLNTVWYSIKQPGQYATIGIVSVEDRISKKRKMYIGPAIGSNFERDVAMVVEHGVPLNGKEIAKWITEELEGEENNAQTKLYTGGRTESTPTPPGDV